MTTFEDLALTELRRISGTGGGSGGSTGGLTDAELRASAIPVSISALPTGTKVNSTALEASRVLKSSAGVLISLTVSNTLASNQFAMLFDSATVPADGAVPLISFRLSSTDARTFDIPITGLTFSTGIVVCNSTTQATKTIGAANCLFLAEVK